MISNWLNIEYAWLLWVAYAVLYVASLMYAPKATSLGFKTLFVVSMVVSLALIVIYPLACAIWFFGGCTLYTLWCMVCSKELHPIKAIISYKMDKAMRMYGSTM
jgi:hypothetical protein